MRYWQPPNTIPASCICLRSWAGRTSRDISQQNSQSRKVKRKRPAGCQHGLITAGIGGVWCWRSTLDNGDTLTLPMLDEFQWPNRSVLMCPDSDAWHEGKKAGRFSPDSSRSPKTYNSAGHRSSSCVLPDIHGAKAGLDDWFLVPGHDVEQSWLKLERIALDASRFQSLTAWWQKWKEKQATHAAIKDQDAEELDISETAGLFLVQLQSP